MYFRLQAADRAHLGAAHACADASRLRDGEGGWVFGKR